MKNCLFSLFCFLVVTNLHLLVASSHSAGFSGSTTVTVGAGNSYQPTYYIATAGLAGDPVYSGVVANVHDGNNSLTFASEENSTLGMNPPFVQGAFNMLKAPCTNGGFIPKVEFSSEAKVRELLPS